MIYQWFPPGPVWAMSVTRKCRAEWVNWMDYSSKAPQYVGAVRAFFFVVALATWSMLGCQSKPPAPTDTQSENAAAQSSRLRTTTELERGPVRVSMDVHPGKVRLSDELTLTLKITHSLEVSVNAPSFVEDLGSFVVRDFSEQPLVREGDHWRIEQQYRLEPTESGELEIDPIPVLFTDTRPDGDGQEHTMLVEPLIVEVTTPLGDTAPSLHDLRPLSDPIASRPSRRWNWIGLFGLIPVITGMIAAIWWWFHRVRALRAALLSPRENAFHQLALLARDDLASRDVKAYFAKLTQVVRQYIEAVTAVRAPEQTTAEFFQAIAHHPAFQHEAAVNLRGFLEAADLVKFAAHRPGSDDVANSLERARVLIESINGTPESVISEADRTTTEQSA